jgi:hypothetical protein
MPEVLHKKTGHLLDKRCPVDENIPYISPTRCLDFFQIEVEKNFSAPPNLADFSAPMLHFLRS